MSITALALAAAVIVAMLRFRRTVAAAWRWQRRESAVSALMRLPDKTLADIGLHRSEIRSVVAETDDDARPRERRRGRVRRLA
jgi:uncharacterized protein YjiS (DUF1127 family)